MAIKSNDGSSGAASSSSRNAEIFTCYPALSASHKKVYDELLGHIQALETKFEIRSDFRNEDLVKILRAIRFDHPELFWFSEASNLQVVTRGPQVTKTLTLDTYYPIAQVPAMQSQIDAIVKAFAASLPKDATAYDKVHEAYDFVIDNTSYDLNAPNNQSMAAVFLNHKAVCAGYSNAFDYLLRAVGVPCGTVQGVAKGGGVTGPHLWNIVCIDGVYAHVDATWGELEVAADSGNKKTEGRSHNYLCVTTEEILRSRSIDSGQNVPECTSRAYDWFGRQGLLLDGFVSGEYDALLAAACGKGERELAVKFKTKAAFDKCVEWVGSSKVFTGAFGKKLAKTSKSNQVSISWSRDENLRVVDVLW